MSPVAFCLSGSQAAASFAHVFVVEINLGVVFARIKRSENVSSAIGRAIVDNDKFLFPAPAFQP